MLFAWIGYLKNPGDPVPQEVNREASEFIAQPFLAVRSVGPLCDDHGRRAGMLMIFEADDRSAAEALIANSPYLRAGLYDRHELHEYRNEVG